MTPNERGGLVKAVGQIIRESLSNIRAEISDAVAEMRGVLTSHADAIEQMHEKISAIPQGPVGPIGLTGERGEKGIDGAPGRDGIDGKDGAQGLRGERGETGLTGERGLDGAAGRDGKDGLPGEKGEKGEIGATGPQGDIGLKGDSGAQGAQGAIGPVGLTGSMGEHGKDGLSGKDGRDGRDGKDGRDGSAGRDALDIEILSALPLGEKTVPRGTFLKYRGGIVRAQQDVSGQEVVPDQWSVIVDGIADVLLSHSVDLRTIMFGLTLTSGRSFQHTMQIPVTIYRGVFEPDFELGFYSKGDQVTHDGSLWICTAAETVEKPGNSKHWTLSVKRGQNGRDLRPETATAAVKPIQLGGKR